jgi:hypothetical protein
MNRGVFFTAYIEAYPSFPLPVAPLAALVILTPCRGGSPNPVLAAVEYILPYYLSAMRFVNATMIQAIGHRSRIVLVCLNP